MKLFLPHPFAAHWLRVVVIALALTGASHTHAQSSIDVANIQEQGDEMSRQVGGFFRKLFYGEDRNANYQPQQAPRSYPQQPSYQSAPPAQQQGYQYAPPPARNSQRAESLPPRQRSPQKEAVAPSKKTSTRSSDTDKPRRKDDPIIAHSSAPNKRPVVQAAPPKHEDPVPSKQVSKRKSYTPPTIAGDDETEAKSKKPSKTESSPPSRKENAVKAPAQDTPPSIPTKKTEPSMAVKSTPHGPTKSDAGGISPYTDSYSGGTTLMAPKDSIASSSPPAKTEEPKKKDSVSSSNTAPAPAGDFPFGKASVTHPGTVASPYPPYSELDVTGLPSGSLAVDPTTNKVFKIP